MMGSRYKGIADHSETSKSICFMVDGETMEKHYIKKMRKLAIPKDVSIELYIHPLAKLHRKHNSLFPNITRRGLGVSSICYLTQSEPLNQRMIINNFHRFTGLVNETTVISARDIAKLYNSITGGGIFSLRNLHLITDEGNEFFN